MIEGWFKSITGDKYVAPAEIDVPKGTVVDMNKIETVEECKAFLMLLTQTTLSRFHDFDGTIEISNKQMEKFPMLERLKV